MTFLIVFLTAILVLDCAFLILLVLVQLPKKEAGAGIAFGGAATDALFGAGSGTALTKITKYAAAAFFAITLTLAVLTGMQKRSSGPSAVEEKLKEQASKTLPTAPTGNIPLQTPSTVTTPAKTETGASAPKTEIPLTTPTAKPEAAPTPPAPK